MSKDMQHSECLDPAVGELLVPYGLGTLSSEEAARFEDHLMECDYCRVELEAGFSTFTQLQKHRAELTHEMKNSGDDYESLLTRLKQPAQPVPQKVSAKERWRRVLDVVLNPWVYGPAVTAAVGIILIVHLTGRTPVAPPLASRVVPQTLHTDSSLPTLHDESPPPSQTNAESDLMKMSAKVVPQEEIPKASKEHAPVIEKHELQSQAAPAPKAVATPPAESLPEALSDKVEIAQKQARIAPKQDSMALADQAAIRAVEDRALALLSAPPPYVESPPPTMMGTPGGMQGIRGGRSSSGIAQEKASSTLEYRTSGKDSSRVDHLRAGIDGYRQGKFSIAANELATYVRTDSLNGKAWFYLGAAQLQLHQWSSAVQALTNADMWSGGDDPLPRYYLTLAIIASGDLSKSRQLIGTLPMRQDSIGQHAAELQRLLEKVPAHK